MVKEEYEIVEGKWPEEANELILFTNYNKEILRSKFYELGLLPKKEYEDILNDLNNNKKVDIKKVTLNPKDIIGHEYKILTPSDYYEKDGESFVNIKDDKAKVDKLIDEAKTLKIVGIARKVNDDDNRIIQTPLAYTENFTKEMISYVEDQEIIKRQVDKKDINVLNNLKFKAENEDEKVNQSKNYLENLSENNLFKVNAWIMQNRKDLVEKNPKRKQKTCHDGKNSCKSNRRHQQ